MRRYIRNTFWYALALPCAFALAYTPVAFETQVECLALLVLLAYPAISALRFRFKF